VRCGEISRLPLVRAGATWKPTGVAERSANVLRILGGCGLAVMLVNRWWMEAASLRLYWLRGRGISQTSFGHNEIHPSLDSNEG
jgi:hypothetical protein